MLHNYNSKRFYYPIQGTNSHKNMNSKLQKYKFIFIYLLIYIFYRQQKHVLRYAKNRGCTLCIQAMYTKYPKTSTKNIQD